nr:hypothetical protein [Halobaculum salinum]
MAHDWAFEWSLRNMIPEINGRLLETLPVAGGIAVVETRTMTRHLSRVFGLQFSGSRGRNSKDGSGFDAITPF